jgi:hypothetical protein
MKTFCLTILIGVLLLICANRIQARPTQTQLHQIELKKPDNEKTGINAFQRLQDFENFYAFSPLVISSSISQPVQSDDNLIKLKSDMLSVYEQLIIYRNYYLKYLIL